MTIELTERQADLLADAATVYLRELQGLEGTRQEQAVLKRVLDKISATDAHQHLSPYPWRHPAGNVI